MDTLFDWFCIIDPRNVFCLALTFVHAGVRELVRPYPQADRLITTAAQLLKNFADWLFPVPDINTIGKHAIVDRSSWAVCIIAHVWLIFR